MKIHEKYILRCIELAKNGLGTTYPNPLVGSVVVHDNKIIGEGWHFKAGTPHAEVNAIKNVSNDSLLPDATLYVNLEPCSHFGKTPPCADLIVAKGIKKVVIGTLDPNNQVAGKGLKKLTDAGCEVVVGVLEDDCDALNKRFFSMHKARRPYIFLKWAETTDGFIAPSTKNTQAPVWITSKSSRQQAHKLRAEEQAILVGTQTVLDDNPSLTTRDWSGDSPWRIVIDRKLKIPQDAAVYDKKAPTIFITERERANEKSLYFEKIDFQADVAHQIVAIIYRYQLQSLIVEGGAKTIQTFIDASLWDEAFLFVGPDTFKTGIKGPRISGTILEKTSIDADQLLHFKNMTP